MRLSIVLLAIILFLMGLSDLGAVTLTPKVFGWLFVIDAGLLVLQELRPLLPVPKHKSE